MTKINIETGTITIGDMWDDREPIVLHGWWGGPSDPHGPRVISLSWLQANEPELVQHMQAVLDSIDLLDFDTYGGLLHEYDDELGYDRRSLWGHAYAHTVTDVGCHELAAWATALCGFAYLRRPENAKHRTRHYDLHTPLSPEDAREWQRLVAEEPRFGEIEVRARQFAVPPHLRNTFAGNHRGWALYGQLCDEAYALLIGMLGKLIGINQIGRARQVAQVVIFHTMYRVI